MIVLAALASTAGAEPVHPQLTLGPARLGAASIAGTAGMSPGFFAHGGLRFGATTVSLAVDIGEVCLTAEDCNNGPTDLSFALHLRRRIKEASRHHLFFGGGPSMHGIWSASEVVARGQTSRTQGGVQWQPGADLVLAAQLRNLEGRSLHAHIGLRAFVVRSGEQVMTKPYSTRDSRGYGIDGGLIFESAYVIGR
jgi:hypothetical protein